LGHLPVEFHPIACEVLAYCHLVAYYCRMQPDGNLIRRLRKQSRRETLTGFAARVGVDAGQLSRIERGLRTYASYGWLHRVAEGLGVPVEAIARDIEGRA
jgi:hypothetical protein